MSSDTVISVESVAKDFEIYSEPGHRLLQYFMPKLRRSLGFPVKNYCRKFRALNEVTLKISKGETVGIIGRNGAGKSTLLQIICGILSPSFGSASVSGRVAALLELGSGFNPEYTGRENIRLNAQLLGLSLSTIDHKLEQIIEFSGIRQFIDQQVKTYSSGMVVRLAFSVAIHSDPDVLIVDEALAVGDIRFQNICIRKIRELKSQGVTILFVSHSSGQIEALCDRAVWLESGVIKADGSPAEIVRDFINFMVHDLERGEDKSKNESKVQSKSDEQWSWIDIPVGRHVQSTGEAEITQFRILSGEIENPVVISEAAKLMLEIEIQYNGSVSYPLLACGIFNSLNEPIVHFNSENIGQSLPGIDGKCKAIYTVEFTMPLLCQGQYLLSLGIDDGFQGANRILYHVYDAWVFEFRPPSSRKNQAGYVYISDSKIYEYGITK